MKLGAQFYSLRDRCQTQNGLYESMKRIKDIGYDVVQISGCCDIEAERLRSYIDELSLPVSCTHKPFELITEHTDELISYHKKINCPVIGLGYMPDKYHSALDGVRAFLKDIEIPMKKINSEGLRFAYHNHAFEFDDIGGTVAFDVMAEEASELDFILDVYWVRYAGHDPMKYIELFGKENRMTNIHFKDMKSDPKGPICPCGDGITDFKSVYGLCKKYGIENALVEQDNAPESGDSIGQMEISYKHLAPIFGK